MKMDKEYIIKQIALLDDEIREIAEEDLAEVSYLTLAELRSELGELKTAWVEERNNTENQTYYKYYSKINSLLSMTLALVQDKQEVCNSEQLRNKRFRKATIEILKPTQPETLKQIKELMNSYE